MNFIKIRQQKDHYSIVYCQSSFCYQPKLTFDNYVSGNISGTQINAPLFPQNTGGDRSSMESLGEFGELRRLSVVDFVSSLRPARLIGTVLPLCTWKDYFKSNINKIKGGDVRKYYEEQNHLIENSLKLTISWMLVKYIIIC